MTVNEMKELKDRYVSAKVADMSVADLKDFAYSVFMENVDDADEAEFLTVVELEYPYLLEA